MHLSHARLGRFTQSVLRLTQPRWACISPVPLGCGENANDAATAIRFAIANA